MKATKDDLTQVTVDHQLLTSVNRGQNIALTFLSGNKESRFVLRWDWVFLHFFKEESLRVLPDESLDFYEVVFSAEIVLIDHFDVSLRETSFFKEILKTV